MDHGPGPKNDKLWTRTNIEFKHIIWKVSFWVFGKSKKCYIGSTVLKLWLLKDVQLHPSVQLFGDSFSCHNLNSVDPISTILWFSESLERDVSNGVIKLHIWAIKVFANLAGPWIIAHGPRPKNDKLWSRTNIGLKHIIWKVSFWAFKKVDIGSTVLKLWLLKDVQLHPSVQLFGDSFSCHNLNSVDPISTILWFSESLERDVSNGIIKLHIWAIKVFANLDGPWIIAHGPKPKNDKLWPWTNIGSKYIIWKVSF